MLPLASAGFHAIAPDMRGYGRTTGWDDSYDGDVFLFRHTNLVRDALGLVSAFGYRTTAVVGRDAGSPVAAYCALIRPDVFRSVAMMTSPFAGPPALAFNTVEGATQAGGAPAEHQRRPGETVSTAEALPSVLHDARGEREHDEGPSGAARLHSCLLPLQERGLEREQALQAGIADCRRARPGQLASRPRTLCGRFLDDTLRHQTRKSASVFRV
jgi:pimeloyl-ACP methyl ester carboxylesterase